MNPVLILTHNCLELTKRCVESVRNQDIPTTIYVEDNASTDGTIDWLKSSGVNWTINSHNQGVSWGWNDGLGWIFGTDYSRRMGEPEGREYPDHCLVIGNDTSLAPWSYRTMLSLNVPFVTGVDVAMSPLLPGLDPLPLNPHPDFSCFLIRRECWEKVGPFNERFVHYCGDCDYHIRAHRLGIPLWKANIPYNHERSSTLKKASPEDRRAIEEQANKDREVFRSLYGCLPGEPAYFALFSEGTQDDSQ